MNTKALLGILFQTRWAIEKIKTMILETRWMVDKIKIIVLKTRWVLNKTKIPVLRKKRFFVFCILSVLIILSSSFLGFKYYLSYALLHPHPLGHGHNNTDPAVLLVKPIPVEVANAEYQEKSKEIVTTGRTQADEIIDIKTSLAGTIQEINFSIGSTVQTGDILAVLDTAEVDSAINLKTEEYQMKENLLKATKELFDKGVISYREYVQSSLDFFEVKQNLYALLSQKEKHYILAPAAGIVESKMVSLGESIGAKDRLAVLHNTGKIKIIFHLDESEHLLLKENCYAEIYIPAIDERLVLDNFKMSKIVQDKNYSFYVESVIENSDDKIIPGLFANIRLVLDKKMTSVRVPNSAVICEGDTNFVFVIEHNIAKKVPVIVGDNQGDTIDILDGLAANDKVVVSEKNKLTAGALVVIEQNNSHL